MIPSLAVTSRRKLRPFLALLGMAGCLSGGCQKSGELAYTADGRAQVRMQLDWYPQTEYGGYYQAAARGFYREANLEVTILGGGAAVGVKETVATGRAEFGSTDGNDVIVAISRGMPIVIVAAEMQTNPQALMFHRSHPLATFADLNGRTLMARPGNAWVEYLQKSRSVQFDLIPVTTDLTSFLLDETMVRQCFVTQEPYSARQRGASVDTLLVADSGFAPYRVIFSSREFVARHPAVVTAFVRTSIQGFDDMLEHDPAPAFDALAAANNVMTPAIMDYTRETLREMRLIQGNPAKGEHTGLITRERIAGQIEILSSLGLLDRPLTVDEVAVFDFLP